MGATVVELGDFNQLVVRMFLVSKQPFCQQWLWQNCDKKVTYYKNVGSIRLSSYYMSTNWCRQLIKSLLSYLVATVRALRFTQFLIKSLLSQPDCFLVNITYKEMPLRMGIDCGIKNLLRYCNAGWVCQCASGGHLRKCFSFFLSPFSYLLLTWSLDRKYVALSRYQW